MNRQLALVAAAIRAYDAVTRRTTTCDCGASWDVDDGYECWWCARATMRHRDDQRHRLLRPDWADDQGDRYDGLSPADKVVWDRTRGIVRGVDSVKAWTRRLADAVDNGLVTDTEALTASIRAGRRRHP